MDTKHFVELQETKQQEEEEEIKTITMLIKKY